jgi:hypothetical protein
MRVFAGNSFVNLSINGKRQTYGEQGIGGTFIAKIV